MSLPTTGNCLVLNTQHLLSLGAGSEQNELHDLGAGSVNDSNA